MRMAMKQAQQALGPLLHARERRRWQGRLFRMLKFRSMWWRRQMRRARPGRQKRVTKKFSLSAEFAPQELGRVSAVL